MDTEIKTEWQACMDEMRTHSADREGLGRDLGEASKVDATRALAHVTVRGGGREGFVKNAATVLVNGSPVMCSTYSVDDRDGLLFFRATFLATVSMSTGRSNAETSGQPSDQRIHHFELMSPNEILIGCSTRLDGADFPCSELSISGEPGSPLTVSVGFDCTLSMEYWQERES